MLPKFIIKDFIEQFNILDIKKANIKIKHRLYGNQKSNQNQCVLYSFVDEDRIGFVTDDLEKKYITFDELQEVGIDDNGCFLKSDVMEIYITFFKN